jgi:hypothetical protein
VALPEACRPSTARCALAALGDLVRPRFLIAFLVSALLLLFFANLSGAGLASVLVRGLVLSWLGFVLVRRVDFLAFGAWLDRRAGLGLSRSLPAAIGVLGRPTEPEAKTDDGPEAGPPAP